MSPEGSSSATSHSPISVSLLPLPPVENENIWRCRGNSIPSDRETRTVHPCLGTKCVLTRLGGNTGGFNGDPSRVLVRGPTFDYHYGRNAVSHSRKRENLRIQPPWIHWRFSLSDPRYPQSTKRVCESECRVGVFQDTDPFRTTH